MQWNYCKNLGFPIDTILARFDPEVILLLQSKFWLKAKVWEETSKIYFQDGESGGHLGFSIGSFSYFVSTRCPNAHLQVSVQLDYRGDGQNMNSQHLSHINVYGPYNCMGKQIWPCRKNVKRQQRTIILAILIDLLTPIICAKIRP